MLQSVGKLFQRRKSIALDDTDVRQFAERWFRSELASTAVYCDQVSGGRVKVRVSSPLLQQEALLLQYDLGLALKSEVDFELKELVVSQF